ncbi:putative inner membrane ABC-transporter [Klebsiella pneumoniae]|uniref:Inner membrane ABC-transporter n=1 Tax=Klebsiella pneumoniae TaxID=573 RepID=A0A378A0R9_KLEPN|nr:putative inner membrane ABC-transporter [Klebsiella pneumoniae]STU93484.1 putative inner membrane ABC-transporter [Klebsiella pneumoniae]
MSTSDTAVSKPGKPGPIRQVLTPIRGQLIAAAVLAGLGTMLTLVPLAGIAHIARIVLGDAGAAPAQGDIWWTVVASVASVFAGMALVSAGELTAHLADNRITHHLRLAAARRLAQVPLGWFTSRASGEVKQAMQDDIATLHSLTAHFYTAVGRAVGAILISVIYLFALDWRMAVAALLPFPGFFLFLRHAMKTGGANMQEFVARMGRINSATVEFVGGIPVVKAFGATGRAHGGYREAVDAFAEAFTSFTRPLVAAMAHAHAMIAPVTVLGVVLAFGALFSGLGWMAPVDVLPFALVAPGICAPLLLLHTLLHDLGSATGAAQRVLALLETPVLEPVAPDQQRIPAGHEVRFENVGYAYGDGHPALSNISFTLAPGTVTAIVGPSGAGKSTLARLLLRFFDPSEGRITLGGVDLRQMSGAQLAGQISQIFQDSYLFTGSIADNIRIGKPNASDAEVMEAARLVGVAEIITRLPQGLDTPVGEGGARLSGGERQRIAIARALIKDAPILLVDEATAALDAENQAAIAEALARLRGQRTLIVIAHQLSTVAMADQIVVLEEGQVIEQGTPAQLREREGRYAQFLRERQAAKGWRIAPAASGGVPS